MAPVEYGWRPGVHLQKGAHVPAQMVGERLEQLRLASSDDLTADRVVADANAPSSPLHPLFEWDDDEAAHQYRLVQARSLIRSVVVHYPAAPEGPRTAIAFVNIRQDDHHYYTATAVALSDPARRAIVLRQAWNDFQALRKRYQDLGEFAAVFAALDGVEETMPPAAA
ncbi:MAG: hypothetical protein H7840_12625 [Alphaproteobacteria bacterium]